MRANVPEFENGEGGGKKLQAGERITMYVYLCVYRIYLCLWASIDLRL